MIRFRVLIGLFAGVAIAAPLSSTLSAGLKEDVERFAKPFVASGNVVALTVGAMKGDDQHIAGFGETKQGNKKTPDADTVFEIGSISKVFTGIMLADMVERGELKLNDPVAKHLPKQFVLPTYEEKEITLAHLSSHSSALPRMPGNFKPADRSNPYADYSLDQMAAFLKAVKLTRPPAKRYLYSNLAVGLLGNALAHRAGRDYNTLLTERVLTPLGMKDTGITFTKDQRNRMAHGYNARLKSASNWDLPTFAGAGGIRSTARQMMTFLQANLSGKSKLEAALQRSYQPQLKLPDGRQQMALGWHIAADGSTYWHNGQTGGYHAFAAFNRKGNVGVVILVTGNPTKIDAMGFRLLQALSGMKVDPITLDVPANIDTKIYDDYLGTYQLFPQFALTVTRTKNHLFIQATNQDAIEVFPKSKDKFFYKAVEAKIEFLRDKNGNVNEIVLFQNGLRMPGKRVKK